MKYRQHPTLNPARLGDQPNISYLFLTSSSYTVEPFSSLGSSTYNLISFLFFLSLKKHLWILKEELSIALQRCQSGGSEAVLSVWKPNSEVIFTEMEPYIPNTFSLSSASNSGIKHALSIAVQNMEETYRHYRGLQTNEHYWTHFSTYIYLYLPGALIKW